MIRIMFRNAQGHVDCDLPADQLEDVLRTEHGALWIDMQSPSQDEYKLVLEHTFHFHPLAIEDAINDIHLPKIDDYGSYLYLVFHTVGLGREPMAIETEEVDVFLGLNYLVTIHDQPRRSIDRAWDTDHHVATGLARGPAMLLYEMLDNQVDSYIPIIDAFEAQLERLGDDIFRSNENERDLLNRLLTSKSSSLRLQRILAPQRELLGRLATNEYRSVPAPARIYFRDVYDHLARLANLAESTRDLAGSTIETHLALVNNRMNEIMKVLTIMSSIFIPLSFIAGIYGMNFDYMPELSWRYGYLMVWGIFLLVGFGLLYMFKRRKWI